MLTLNPMLSLKLMSREVSPSPRLTASWGRRGLGGSRLELGYEQEPELFETLLTFVPAILPDGVELHMPDVPETVRRLLEAGDDAHEDGEFSLTTSPAMAARLEECGILIEESDAPRAVELDITLPDRLPDLIPLSGLDVSLASAGGELVVYDGCTLQEGSEPPARLASRLTQFPMDWDSLLWVEDPGTKVLSPYALGSAAGEAARRVLEGKVSPADLPAPVRDVLAMARVLVPPGWKEREAARRAADCARLAEELPRTDHAVLRGLVSPLLGSMLRSHYRELEWEGQYVLESSGKSTRYGDPVCRYLHEQVTDVINRVTLQAAERSFTHLALYPSPGYLLQKHRDRPQCRWNVSLLLDADPEPALADAWPLHVEDEAGVAHAAALGIGDGVLYSGVKSTHWREMPASPQRTVVAMFFFVDPSFDGDRR